MTQATAVVLDCDQIGRYAIRVSLSRCGVLPICFEDEWICLENIYHLKPAFAVFRPASVAMVMRFLNIARATGGSLPIIVLSDQQEIKNLITRQWTTNLWFLSYPVDQTELQKMIDAFSVLSLNPECPVLVAGSPVSQERIARLPLYGLSSEPLLIQGEPGVGKRHIARAIHRCSAAKEANLLQVRAQDISGAWIHRIRQRIDRLPQREGSPRCYVIEHIEKLTRDLQSQLLLILDTKPSGHGDRRGPRPSMRFITLADDDLERLCREGYFREDLYHRLSVFKMTVPPLRDRKADVPVLADFFAAKYGLEERGGIVRLPEDVRAAFMGYHWPGNVAELEGTVKKALARNITNWVDHLQGWCRDHVGRRCDRSPAGVIDVEAWIVKLLENNQEMSLKKAAKRYTIQIEKHILSVALSKTRGNCKKAAVLLNISYKSMLNKAKEYRLVG